MPLYEYQCQQCGERIEALQRFSDDLLTTCETCGGDLKKLLSAPAVQFKGSGWYVTDYAGKGGDKKSGGEAKGGGESKDGGSSASESGGGESKSGESTKDSSTTASGDKKSAAKSSD